MSLHCKGVAVDVAVDFAVDVDFSEEQTNIVNKQSRPNRKLFYRYYEAIHFRSEIIPRSNFINPFSSTSKLTLKHHIINIK